VPHGRAVVLLPSARPRLARVSSTRSTAGTPTRTRHGDQPRQRPASSNASGAIVSITIVSRPLPRRPARTPAPAGPARRRARNPAPPRAPTPGRSTGTAGGSIAAYRPPPTDRPPPRCPPAGSRPAPPRRRRSDRGAADQRDPEISDSGMPSIAAPAVNARPDASDPPPVARRARSSRGAWTREVGDRPDGETHGEQDGASRGDRLFHQLEGDGADQRARAEAHHEPERALGQGSTDPSQAPRIRVEAAANPTNAATPCGHRRARGSPGR